jgi:hypothetical protein
MWTCSNCGRIFGKAKQPHSCNRIPLEQHFKNKEKAEKLFNYLIKQIGDKIGKCQIIPIPCCIHLFGTYDFLAVIPKRDGLEIRFALNHKIDNPRIKQYVPISAKVYKNCIDIKDIKEINEELTKWIKEAYFLKDKKAL